MGIYYFAFAFDTSIDPQSDGTHYDAQYGFGYDDGSVGVSPVGSGSGASGRQFESVSISAGSGNSQNQFAVAVFSNLVKVSGGQSYVRLSFRPAHDVAPATTLPASPLDQVATQDLLNGVLLSTANINSGVNGQKYGLPTDYSTQWLFPPCKFASGNNRSSGDGQTNLAPPEHLRTSPRRSVNFELTAELTIYEDGNLTPYYFKVDPEMVIDF